MDTEEETRHLEKAIIELETKIHEQETRNKLLLQWKEKNCPCPATEEGEVRNARLQSLKHQLDMMKQFTSVQFTWIKSEMLGIDGMNIECRRIVEGKCGDVQFELGITTVENLESVKDHKVTHLSIAVSEFFSNDMQEHIERLAEASNVQGFLRLMEGYCTWREARQSAFNHFTTAHPKLISQSGPDRLQIKCKNCLLEVSWHLKVTTHSNVLPHISLSVHMPPQVKKKHQQLYSTMEHKFQLMLSTLGIEQTLNCIVQIAS